MKDSGVSFYTKGQALITVNFPEKEIMCQYCPFCLEVKDSLKRWRCQLTTELIFYPFNQVGQDCPLKVEVMQHE